MRTTDKYICKLLAADNKQGMNLLFKKYFESLVIWADTFLNDMDQSQDLVQDLFVGIWRKKTYHNWNPDKLASYLHVAVKNACFNKIKKVDILKNTADIESFDKIYDEFESNKEEIVPKFWRKLKNYQNVGEKL